MTMATTTEEFWKLSCTLQGEEKLTGALALFFGYHCPDNFCVDGTGYHFATPEDGRFLLPLAEWERLSETRSSVGRCAERVQTWLDSLDEEVRRSLAGTPIMGSDESHYGFSVTTYRHRGHVMLTITPAWV